MLTSYEEFLDKHRAEEAWLTRRLLKLGMPQHLRGYKCATVAIILCMERSEYLDAITTELYPAMSKILSISTGAVERALRNAIEITWLYGDMESQCDLFGNSVNPHKGRPTNTMFIATMYYAMRREFVICGKRDASTNIGFFPIG